MRYLSLGLLLLAASSHAATIQAPTEMVDGTPLPLADLSHYILECAGAEEQLAITGPEQTFNKAPNTSCRAKAVTKAGEVSAWSNTYKFPNVPAAPIISD